MPTNRRFTLQRRPVGMPVAGDFALDQVSLPALADGEFLVANHYASLDPAIRGWLDAAPSYLPPVPLGDPVRATTVGIVAASRAAAFPVGQWVVGLNAIETHSRVRPGGFTSPVDPALVPSVTNYLSVLGAVGMTAYFGLIDLGRPQPGQTVVVSGAAGAVGSLVGQIARLHGCRAVGIAGGAAKCARLIDRFGFDAAVDYRGRSAAELADAIRAAAPGGTDILFENVGGDVLDAGLLTLNPGARVVLCGLIAEYNRAEGPLGARNLWQLIVRSASIHGLLVSDYVPRFGEGIAAMAGWLGEGKLAFDEHVEEGIDNALPAFLRLFNGTNTGKLILKLA